MGQFVDDDDICMLNDMIRVQTTVWLKLLRKQLLKMGKLSQSSTFGYVYAQLS